MAIARPTAASGVRIGRMPVSMGRIRPIAPSNSARPMKRTRANGTSLTQCRDLARVARGRKSFIPPASANAMANKPCRTQSAVFTFRHSSSTSVGIRTLVAYNSSRQPGSGPPAPGPVCWIDDNWRKVSGTKRLCFARGEAVPGGPVNLADPRVKRTRKLITDAFRALVVEKGFHAVSVQDVAERATVNRTTFYAHFVDKYDLLDQSISELFRQERERLLPDHASLTRENLRILMVAVAEFLRLYPGHCTASDHDLNRVIEARVQRELESYLRGWFGRSIYPDGAVVVNPETVAMTMSWVIFGAGIAWSRGATS